MKIQLLESRHSPGAAGVGNLAGPHVVWIVANVLYKQVSRRPEVRSNDNVGSKVGLNACRLVNQVTVNIPWSDQSSLSRLDQGN
jgi:hypothetical protein